MYARKAMSPLIATVLLIAFAVALGAMIMNWSTDTAMPENTPSQSAAPCDNVRIEVGEAFGKPLFCYQDDQVKFNVVNVGKTAIAGLQLRTINTDLELGEHDVPSSSIAIGGTFLGQIPVTIQGKVHAELVPYVLVSGEKQYCVQQKLVHDGLPACSE